MTSRQIESTDIQNFMKHATKRVVILSGTASTGLDLHSDLNEEVKNRQQRHHITMEVGWAPELLLQQLGNTFVLKKKQYHCCCHLVCKRTDYMCLLF